jgi:hypothetical protein
LKAYKNTYNGISAFSASTKVVVSNSAFVDNAWGLTANMVPSGSEHDEHISEIADNTLYGSSLSPDCPQESNGGFCFKKDK